ncbi:nuclear transport factor 2 family protein [Alkalimonas collagenimarina]|uniref:Nuclear transport factor 2 family protein n=1 Tax=Alkalimonas collagenimarina TaxID=400390 RepID=A0ABT9GUL4_9GAMM|nr:nuclear transport factor 2 family protein [Alkalimonas collagenimarina]MDP4534742.1 nuclear transport factor 2 family protein [Alkalimonas collagenimarina]
MKSGMFEPTKEQQQEIYDWFAKYDELTKAFKFEAMADRGLFPMYVITDDSTGNGVTRTWSRNDFITSMKSAMENTPEDIEYNMTRTPYMINANVAIVLTEWRPQKDSDEGALKYADVLLKENGDWRFQTMIQGGWGDFL